MAVICGDDGGKEFMKNVEVGEDIYVEGFFDLRRREGKDGSPIGDTGILDKHRRISMVGTDFGGGFGEDFRFGNVGFVEKGVGSYVVWMRSVCRSEEHMGHSRSSVRGGAISRLITVMPRAASFRTTRSPIPPLPPVMRTISLLQSYLSETPLLSDRWLAQLLRSFMVPRPRAMVAAVRAWRTAGEEEEEEPKRTPARGPSLSRFDFRAERTMSVMVGDACV